MHWTDERAARAELGKAFRNAGARIYGWHDDHSDAMTDYWDPESWWGLATHRGYTIVCGANSRRWYPEDGEPVQFQQNARGKTWHVEKDGEIIASGTGLSKCSRHTYSWQHGISRDYRESQSMAEQGAAELVQKIFRIIDRHIAGQGRRARSGGAAQHDSRIVYQDDVCRVEYRGSWTWIFFPMGSLPEVREMLTAEGFHYSRQHTGWWYPEIVSLDLLLGNDSPSVDPVVYQYAEPIGPAPVRWLNRR